MPEIRRTGFLVAFGRAFEINALDDALDVLDLLITDIAGRAKRLGKQKRLRTLKDLDRSALTLAEVCALILNESMDSQRLREAIYACVPKQRLEQSVAVVNELARPSEEQYHEEMVEQYGRVRPFLHKLLNNIKFECAPSGQSTLAALDYLVDLGPTRKQVLENAPREIIGKPWAAVADGCYASQENVSAAKELGVKRNTFSKPVGLTLGDMGVKKKTFDALRNFRAGVEGNISEFKRSYGAGKATWKGHDGFKAFVWSSALTYNLIRMVRFSSA